MSWRCIGEWIYKCKLFDLAPVGGELSISLAGHVSPGEIASGTHWIGGWMGPGVGIDDVENSHPSVVQPVASRHIL
jgi:hypothetical protein